MTWMKVSLLGIPGWYLAGAHQGYAKNYEQYLLLIRVAKQCSEPLTNEGTGFLVEKISKKFYIVLYECLILLVISFSTCFSLYYVKFSVS